MLNKIIEWSLRNQFMVVIGVLFAIAGGLWAMKTMQLDAIPDLSDVQVTPRGSSKSSTTSTVMPRRGTPGSSWERPWHCASVCP